MIQATDIRVGATFYSKQLGEEIVLDREVISLIFDKHSDFYSLDDLDPIPLTEKRLMQLGAIKEELDGGAVGFYDSYSIEGIELSHVFTNMWGIVGLGIKPMKYVHDIQLVVLALTGKEIQINHG